MSERKHLPLYGPGPVIMGFSVVLSVACIFLSRLEALSFGRIGALRISLKIIGILALVASPLLCWGFETVVLKRTEEQWLAELYGEEYRAYCERVNRLIPWFPKGQ